MNSPQRLGDRAVVAATSWFGLGYMPVAPGTWGTLGALPLWWAWDALPWPTQALLATAATGLAIALSARAERLHGSHDSGKIVIDEVCGLLWTVIGVPFRWDLAIAGFLLFRVLDILKPGPVRMIDRELSGGAGVVLDDVLAGVIGLGVLHGANSIFGLW